ncbi:unnamed protein product [Protopolystoma xenopodis]|uniref:Uncharacterized protein n=1 Tax=Protopolystoma xenopodis TaxID=117903 RepID=A0A3S5B109_9PLAT|nr:unnamed protein product [Protopolystoma xenopodis]
MVALSSRALRQRILSARGSDHLRLGLSEHKRLEMPGRAEVCTGLRSPTLSGRDQKGSAEYRSWNGAGELPAWP